MSSEKSNNSEQPKIIIRPTSDYASEDIDKAEDAAKALPAIGEALSQPANHFWQKLSTGLDHPPKEVEVQLSLAFEGKMSWAIVSATAGATVMVKMKWENK